MRTTYTVKVNSETRLRFTADLADASAPLMIVDCTECTPLNTSHASHTAVGAARVVNGYLWSQGGAAFGDDEEIVVSEEGDE